MQSAAFTAYLLGAGGKSSFNQFLRHLGLGDESAQLSKEQKELLIRRADDVVKRISKMKIRRRKNK